VATDAVGDGAAQRTGLAVLEQARRDVVVDGVPGA
jgi:hypothetical protein